MEINSSIKKALESLDPIVGVCMDAFSRVVPASFLKKYEIICYRWRGETEYIAKRMKVFCLAKEYPDQNMKKINTWNILDNAKVKNRLSKKDKFWLLIYAPDEKIEKICQKNSWKAIANSSSLNRYFDNKRIFREVVSEAGVDIIPGETIKLLDFKEEIYEPLVKKYGQKLVFQMAEVTGGGLGTAFVDTKEEFNIFLDKIRRKKKVKPELEHVNVTKYIDGIPASITACTTKHGVLSGVIQAQIQDTPEVIDLTMGSGLFCGHDWDFFKGKETINTSAREISAKIGNVMYKKGYKGIFGLDLLVEQNTGKVYPVECNPRYTDAFPTLSMIYLSKGILPMDIFHILELTGTDYQMDVEEINALYGEPVEGSQIIISSKIEERAKLTGEIKAGVYKYKENELEFIREGYRYEDLKSDDEFVFTEGVPFIGTMIKGDCRIMRIIFKKGILRDKNQLTDEAKNIIEKVYNRLPMVKIE